MKQEREAQQLVESSTRPNRSNRVNMLALLPFEMHRAMFTLRNIVFRQMNVHLCVA